MFTEDQKLVLAAFSLLTVQGLDPTIHKKLDSLAVWISKDVAKMTLIGRGGGGGLKQRIVSDMGVVPKTGCGL